PRALVGAVPAQRRAIRRGRALTLVFLDVGQVAELLPFLGRGAIVPPGRVILILRLLALAAAVAAGLFYDAAGVHELHAFRPAIRVRHITRRRLHVERP